MPEVLYDGGMVKVKRLTDEEKQFYRSLPVGVSQTMDVLRTVAEEDGLRKMFELHGCGYNVVTAMMEDCE